MKEEDELKTMPGTYPRHLSRTLEARGQIELVLMDVDGT